MNLEKKWDWERRKLACKVRIETGNPGADELRSRICELVGIDYSTFQRNYLINSEKALERTVAKEEKKDKDKDRDPPTRPSTVQTALRKINTSLALYSHSDAMRPVTASAEESTSMPAHRKNIYKKFIEVIRSPPRRALYDLKIGRLEMAVEEVEMKPGQELQGANMLDEGEEVDGQTNAKGGSHKAGVNKAAKKLKSKRLPQVQLNDLHVSYEGQAGADEMRKIDPKSLFKPYNGDIFGTESTNSDGMIYLSRMAPSNRRQKSAGSVIAASSGLGATNAPANAINDIPEIKLNEGDDPVIRLEDEEDEEGHRPVNPPSDDKLSGVSSQKEIHAKVHCAMTLCNWTSFDANTDRLAKEGAVQAIMRLSKESDRNIRRYCAAAFRHMSTRATLARQLVSQGGVSSIAELMNNNGRLSKQITVDCTIALVNLTKIVGAEGKLVEDGIVLALMALPNDTEDWDELCARGLFNLTCVDTPYPFMERVIKAFMSLASSSFTSIKHICASALCNIADLRQMRMRMVEEGVIQVKLHRRL